MVDGQLESIWSQLHYATRTLSPVRLVLKVTLPVRPGGLSRRRLDGTLPVSY